MIVFDMFYYSTFRFGTRRLKRSKEDAKMSALSHLAVYSGIFSITMASFIGIIIENQYSRWIVNNAFLTFIIVGVLIYIIFGIRYYKIYDIEIIEKRIMSMPKVKCKLFKWLNILIMISVPILFFLLFRLYLYGHV